MTPPREWSALERDVIDGFFRFSPSHGRVVGDHRYDGVVGDASARAVERRAHEISEQLTRLAHVKPLTRDQHVDRRALIAQLQAAAFELVELRRPFTDPMYYAGFGSELDVSPYLKRNYAPLRERLAVLRRHLGQYGGYLEAARDNLELMLPRPNLQIAIDAIQGQVEYLEGEVRLAADGDPETVTAIENAAARTRAFAGYLKGRLRDAHDGYAMGSERFCGLLKASELVDLDLAALTRMVQTDVERNTQRARQVAERIAPGEGVRAALAKLQDRHPSADSMLEDVRAMLNGLRQFILDRQLMSIPSDVRCLVKATPAYASYITAALDSAGPLETVADESYYYVTVPDRSWSAERTDEWLRYLNYAVLENTSIHEAYPGHFVQALHERLATSLSRRVFWVQSTGEGYAHYCEEMMFEVGYSKDPRYELALRVDALLRDCRVLVSLGLHCQGMTMAEATRVFVDIGLQTELPATREAMRGAWDPLYLNYTLGKLLIYQLRRELERRPGYSLKRFHDDFLRCGNLPIPLIRELLT